jgi:hypothetical protein
VAAESDKGIPQSPELQEPYVREDLDQDLVTHQGEWRKAPTGPLSRGGHHLGAVDDEMVPVIPPMSGPADLVGERNENAQGNEDGDTDIGEEMIDPREELTPG